MFTPDLKPMIDMAVSNLRAVAELIGDGNQTVTPKAAKHARRAKSLVVEVIQQINDIMQAQKATIESEVQHGTQAPEDGVDGDGPVRTEGTKTPRVRK